MDLKKITNFYLYLYFFFIYLSSNFKEEDGSLPSGEQQLEQEGVGRA